ncbi:MAG: hypothetical protein NUV91_04460, partial [Candidatus Omnitrophica bacterium]|nr:hypothetical protein [Candidatus Omnitrophota bacterium]
GGLEFYSSMLRQGWITPEDFVTAMIKHIRTPDSVQPTERSFGFSGKMLEELRNPVLEDRIRAFHILTALLSGLSEAIPTQSVLENTYLALHDQEASQRMSDKEQAQHALIIKAYTILENQIDSKDVDTLAQYVKSAVINEEALRIILDTMAFLANQGSPDTQNILEGNIRRILRKSKAEGVAYVEVTSRERIFIEATMKSHRQRSLAPFLYDDQFDPDLRRDVLHALARGRYIDAGYAQVTESAEVIGYLEKVTEVYKAVKQIAPKELIDRILSGDDTLLEKLQTKLPHLDQLIARKVPRELIRELVEDRDLMLTYYLLKRATFDYRGISMISFERFSAILEQAVRNFEDEHPEVVVGTEEDSGPLRNAFELAYQRAGMAPDEAERFAKEIAQSLWQGNAPLPHNSPFWKSPGEFEPQRIDVIEGITTEDVIRRDEEGFRESLNQVQLILEIHLLLEGFVRVIDRLPDGSLHEREELQRLYENAVERVRLQKVPLMALREELGRMNNEHFYRNQTEAGLNAILQKGVQDILRRMIDGYTSYGRFFSLDLEQARQSHLDDIRLEGIFRRMNGGVLSELNKKRTSRKWEKSFPIEAAIFKEEEITSIKVFMAFWARIAKSARIDEASPLANVFQQATQRAVDLYSEFKSEVKRVAQLTGEPIPQVVYLDFVYKGRLFEAMRFADGAHCCSSSDPEIAEGHGGFDYDQQAPRFLTDATTFFFQLSTGPRSREQVGFVIAWIGIDRNGLPFVGSTYLYLAPRMRSPKLEKAIQSRIEQVLFSLPISMIAQPVMDEPRDENSVLPQGYTPKFIEGFVRLQSLSGRPMKVDGGFPGNVPYSEVFFVKENQNPTSPEGAEEEGGPASGFKDEQLGGIDLNPSKIDLQTQGRMDEGEPFDIEYWRSLQFDGLSPVIIRMTPLSNIPFLLGIKTEP